MAASGRQKISLEPQVLRWARERSSLTLAELAAKASVSIERVEGWEDSGQITPSQIRKLARHTHTPEGFLYLSEPPEERLDIPDLRTVDDRPARPSPDLLDTLHTMQRRQQWMREEVIERGADPLPFVGSASLEDPPTQVADAIRATLEFTAGWASEARSWAEALRKFRLRIDELGVLVVTNGIVGNNTRRKLDPDEFRGLALVDRYAPLVFVNGADARSAQMFTLAHELAHVWLNASGVDNPDPAKLSPDYPAVEKRCNAVAAEFLMPAAALTSLWGTLSEEADRFERIARQFKTSQIAAARRTLDLQLIDRSEFLAFWRRRQEEKRPEVAGEGTGGGDFWSTQGVRLGQRFSQAIVTAVLEGRLLYRDAYSLTGLRGQTFDRFIEKTLERSA